MPSKREILALLNRDELLGIVDQFGLEVPSRRAKDGLVEATAASKKATPPELLPGLTRDSLKALCQGLGLDDSGRDKASLIDRLVSAKVIWLDSAPTASKKNGLQSKPPAPVSTEVESGTGSYSATLQHLRSRGLAARTSR